MQDSIFVNKSSITGTIEAYPSKSYIQRALLLGLLNENGVEIRNYKESSDSLAVLNSIIELGAKVENSEGRIKILGLKDKDFINGEINCNESGLCMRLFAPVLALSHKEFKIRGKNSLLSRGNNYISEILSQLGVKSGLTDHYLSVQGPLRSGKIHIEDQIGSQLISGLMFALSRIKDDSEIMMRNQVSFPYIKMTAELLNRFGGGIRLEGEERIFIRGDREFIPGTIEIEGDWSSAAFFLVAGALAGDVTVTGLDVKSLQADREILRYLKNAGAKVETGEVSVRVRKSRLTGFIADIKDHPDLFIPLVILGLNCAGETRIYNFERLKYKESDRPAVLLSELKKVGAEIEIKRDYVSVKKSGLVFSELDPHNDHRLAMGFGIAALNTTGGLEIKDFNCVNKSFPLFFDTLLSLTEKSV